MRLIKIMFFLLYFVDCFADPSSQKVINRMKEINEALIQVVNLPADIPKQKAALERAKIMVQQAIQIDGITNNASLYAIGGILFDDPLYRERAALLESQAHKGKDSQSRHQVLENEAEAYRQNLMQSIDDIDAMLVVGDLLPIAQRRELEAKKATYVKIKKWVEAQILSHGMLATALYQHKMSQLSLIETGESNVQSK